MSQYGGEMETDNAALSKVEAEAPAEEKYPRNKRELSPHWGGVCRIGTSSKPLQLIQPSTKITKYKDIKLTNYNEVYNLTLSNRGEGVSIDFSEDLNITISGGPMKNVYVLAQVTWHWGEAEHAIGNENAIIEMHLLHRNRKYGNFNEAANHRSGFVALIALYRNVDVDNEVLLELFESINEVKEPGTEVDVEKTIMLRDLLPRNIRDYYYYKGFLTDPPCSESVLQIVFAEQLQCSDQDIQKFHHLKTNKKRRRLVIQHQDIGRRRVYHSFREKTHISGAQRDLTQSAHAMIFFNSVLLSIRLFGTIN